MEKWLRIGDRQSREAGEVSSSENTLLLLPQVASTSVQGVRIMSKFCFIEDDPKMVTTNISNRIRKCKDVFLADTLPFFFFFFP